MKSIPKYGNISKPVKKINTFWDPNNKEKQFPQKQNNNKVK